MQKYLFTLLLLLPFNFHVSEFRHSDDWDYKDYNNYCLSTYSQKQPYRYVFASIENNNVKCKKIDLKELNN